MSFTVYEYFGLAYTYLAFVIGVFGIVANILIIITYAKIGITKSINTSYTAMAISDIGVLLFCVIVFCLTLPGDGLAKILPIIPGDFMLYAAYPRGSFSKLTGCITAYIALERCLCVASPHKVKLLFTQKVTLIVLLVLTAACFIPLFLVSVTLSPVWKVVNNKTVLGSDFFVLPGSYEFHKVSALMYGVILQWPPLFLTVLCTIYLTVQLSAGSKFRNNGAKISKNKNSQKEARLIKTVVMISVLSIGFSSFHAVNAMLSMVDPDAVPFAAGVFGRWELLITNAATMMMLNSCTNIFVYYKLGSKFRRTIRDILHLPNYAEA